MENNGFSLLPQFPAGLRVLVVDDDPTWLKILQKMLRKCSYEVTTCGLAREALNILRDRKDGFDIVISDVNMPDMDGFKLLEHVGLEMDLPVIMMSVDGETSRVMKGIHHGACDYLLKPVRMKELRNIWQHVFRKRRHELNQFEIRDKNQECQLVRSILDNFYDDNVSSEGDARTAKKRKDFRNDDDDENDNPDRSAVKKVRVVWSVDLHQKFVNAVNQIGLDKVGPKKILDLMQVPGLTRENVASHLQKYRLYLGRLQKENKSEPTFGGIMQPSCSSLELKSSDSLLSVMVSQSSSTACFGFSEDEIQRTHEEDLRRFNLPITIARWSLTNSVADTITGNTASQVTRAFSSEETPNSLLKPTTTQRCPDFKATMADESEQCHMHMFNTRNFHATLDECSGQLMHRQPCDVLFDQLKGFLPCKTEDPFFCGNSTINGIPAERLIDTSELVCGDTSTCTIGLEYSSENEHVSFLPVQINDVMLNQEALGTVPSISGSTLHEVYELGQKSFNICEESPCPQLVPTEAILDSPYHEFQLFPLDGYDCFSNVGIDNVEIQKVNELKPKTETQSCPSSVPLVDCCVYDSENLVIDEGLPLDGDHLLVNMELKDDDDDTIEDQIDDLKVTLAYCSCKSMATGQQKGSYCKASCCL